MTQADRIRSFVIQSVIAPAQAEDKPLLIVRAGDIHAGVGLGNAYPAVCSVLRGAKLQAEAGVTLIRQDGPRNGANVWFHFDLTGTAQQSASPPTIQPPPTAARAAHPVNLHGALVLISCTKSKLGHPAPAADLYCSPAFRLKRAMTERAHADWIILSAKHGLVDPGQVIAPYDVTLTTMGVAERRAWAAEVLPILLPRAQSAGRVVALASRSYIEHLAGPLADAGVEVITPLKGLSQGRQLAWLTARA